MRDRILTLAGERGYRPDPAMSALVAYRARTRPRADYGKIAVLHDMDRKEGSFPLSLRQQIEGMRERANLLGYEIELFRVHPDGEKSMKLGRMLYCRGIQGLILTALRMPSLHMDWGKFCTVVIGEYFSLPRLNHIKHHHSEVVTTTYQELRKLGYQKIGFANIRIAEERKHHLYLGAYLKCLYLDDISPKNSPPLFYDQESDWSPIPWLDKNGFDAVMSMVPSDFQEKLKGTRYRVPGKLGLAGYAIPWNDPRSAIAGCTLDYRKMGATAVDLLQAMLHRGQRGTPQENEHYDILLHGIWRPGTSVLKQRIARRHGVARPE